MYTEDMELVLVAWAGLVPFVMLYGAYEGAKVFWLWAGGFFLSLFWLIRLIRLKNISISPEGKWFLTWIAVLAIASVFGIHPVDSFIGGSYRHQGILFFLTLLLFGETLRLIPAKKQSLLTAVLGIGVIVQSLIVVFQKVTAFGVRPAGTIGEPNAAAGYLAIGLLWVWQIFRETAWLKWIVTGLVLYTIVITGSRSGLITALVMLMVPIILSGKKHGMRLVTTFILIAVILFTVVFMQWITVQRPVSFYENRPLIWKLGVSAVVARPLLGYGAESGEVVYDGQFQAQKIHLIDFMVDRSHNLFLDVAMWSGIPGLVVFCGWLWMSVRKLFVAHQYLRLTAVVSWLLFAFFQPVGATHWVLFMCLVSGI